MIRSIISSARSLYLGLSRPALIQNGSNNSILSSTFSRYFSSLQYPQTGATLLSSPIIQNPITVTNRTVTKFSMRKGKRKTVKAVVRRFYRLHWGIWIRRIAGCNKKLWKKSPPRRRRLRQHVFCNATQSRLLDKMVNNYWRKPRYFVDNPYAPYHTREEFRFTATKPRPYFPPEQL